MSYEQLIKGYAAMLTRFMAQVMCGTSSEFHFDDDTFCTCCLSYAMERSVRWPEIADAISNVIYEDTFVRTPKGWRQLDLHVLYKFEQGGPSPASVDKWKGTEGRARPEWSKRLKMEVPWRATPEEVAAEIVQQGKSYSEGAPIVLTGKVKCTQYEGEDEVVSGNNALSCTNMGEAQALQVEIRLIGRSPMAAIY